MQTPLPVLHHIWLAFGLNSTGISPRSAISNHVCNLQPLHACVPGHLTGAVAGQQLCRKVPMPLQAAITCKQHAVQMADQTCRTLVVQLVAAGLRS